LSRESERITLRKRVGIVFQQYNLFPHLTVLDNIVLAPTRILGIERQTAKNSLANFSTRCGWPKRRTPILASCPAASSSAWRSPGRLP
jgi:ABC-type polar amino acid transport system ATPase subunit